MNYNIAINAIKSNLGTLGDYYTVQFYNVESQ